jgi:hypothetical protein
MAVAAACSSSSTSDPLSGGSSSGGGGSGGGSCPSGTDVTTGQSSVQKEGCPTCHGPDMSGQLSPLSGQNTGIYLYPPNLTPDPTTGIGNWRDSDLSLAITQGIDNQGEALCPQMQHYPNMCSNEVTAIIAYLRSLPAVVKQVPRSICPPLKRNPDGGL